MAGQIKNKKNNRRKIWEMLERIIGKNFEHIRLMPNYKCNTGFVLTGSDGTK